MSEEALEADETMTTEDALAALDGRAVLSLSSFVGRPKGGKGGGEEGDLSDDIHAIRHENRYDDCLLCWRRDTIYNSSAAAAAATSSRTNDLQESNEAGKLEAESSQPPLNRVRRKRRRSGKYPLPPPG